MEKYDVKTEWDAEAFVWFVAETNVPGLCAEAKTADELFRKLDIMIFELLALSCDEHQRVPFEFIAHRSSNQFPMFDAEIRFQIRAARGVDITEIGLALLEKAAS